MRITIVGKMHQFFTLFLLICDVLANYSVLLCSDQSTELFFLDKRKKKPLQEELIHSHVSEKKKKKKKM